MGLAVVSDDGGAAWEAELSTSYEVFYREACPVIIRHLLRVHPDRGLIEDAVHEAFIVALRKWAQVREYDVPMAWVRKVARRHLNTVIEQRGNRIEVDLEEAHEQLRVEPSTDLEVEELIIQALQRLPLRQREVMALVFDQYTDREIALELDLQVSTVQQYKSKAHSTLREMGLDDGSRSDRGEKS
ncbi:RNA polymerase sigma factor [Catenuloplanes indicus]|nr:sigma-70 family RNA polymerase sigma factor [Catenuloplanes indicus]